MSFARLMLVCGITALWALSFGLGTQATSHWLKQNGASDTLVGLVHAGYYLGVAAASLSVPAMSRRFGLGTISIGLFLSSISLAMFPFVDGSIGWFTARFASGIGCAWSLVPLETYVSRKAPAERRTEMFSYYAVALTLAGAVGIAVGLEGFDPDGFLILALGQPRNAFFLGAVFPLLGSMIAQHALAREDWELESRATIIRWSWRDHGLSFGTAWGQGFLEGGMLAFLSLDLVNRGLTTSTAGALMGTAMVGVIAFQVPVAWVADRWGRTATLLVCYAVTIAGLLMIPRGDSIVWLGTWLFLFGAFSGAMYPLGLSLLGDTLSANTLARAYAWYLAMECVGSQMGAASMGRVRDGWGGDAMYWLAAGVLAVIPAVWFATRRKTTPLSPTQEQPARRAA